MQKFSSYESFRLPLVFQSKQSEIGRWKAEARCKLADNRHEFMYYNENLYVKDTKVFLKTEPWIKNRELTAKTTHKAVFSLSS